MSHIPVCKITVIEFSVFDSEFIKCNSSDKGIIEKPFYNSTPEQCVQYIWKHMWETAQIKKITEYDIMDGGVRNISVLEVKNNIDHSKGKK